MFNWIRKCFKKKEQYPNKEIKSSLKKIIYAAFNERYLWKKDYGCDVLGADGNKVPWSENKIEFSFHSNDNKLIPLFHYFMDIKEICESLPVINEYHDGVEYKNIRVTEIKNNNGSFIIVLRYDERFPYHKETDIETLKKMFSEYSVLSTDDYMKYKKDFLKYGYWFEPRGKKLYLREPK